MVSMFTQVATGNSKKKKFKEFFIIKIKTQYNISSDTLMVQLRREVFEKEILLQKK